MDLFAICMLLCEGQQVLSENSPIWLQVKMNAHRWLIPSGICSLLVQKLILSTTQLDAESGYTFFCERAQEFAHNITAVLKMDV